MKKLALIPILILGISACGQSELPISKSSTSISDKASSLDVDALSETSNYSPEELLGKSPEEYAALNAKKAEEELSNSKQTNSEENSKEPIIKNGFLQVDWEKLVAPGYDANSILERYQPEIEKIQHGSDAAFELYNKMQEEFDNAPANEEIADKKISIPGFIAPLEQQNGIITEFLLVPYFGACIHSPPPPANQTVYVKTSGDYGIKLKDSYNPIWVSGEIKLDGKNTDIGNASYQIQEAIISPYTL